MSDDGYKVKVEGFEGPLALLLHLIEKSQIDIYDIPIAQVAEQYLAYLRALQEFNMDIATEFIVMASTLLLIKSRMLLPRPVKPTDSGEYWGEEDDPRRELVERLLEYRRYREVSESLRELYMQRRKYIHRPPQLFDKEKALPTGLTVEDLMAAFLGIWETVAEEFSVIAREEITVQEKINDIINLLNLNNGRLDFRQIMTRSGVKAEIVAAFLAILELIRLKRIKVIQVAPFAPIQLGWKD